MMATNIKEELEQDKRDVADIWSAAVEAYRGATKIPIENLPVPKFRSTEDIITYGNQQMDEFHKFRHNQKKVDKLRGLFKQSMNLVQKGAEQLAAAATPAFPPAGAIMTAFSYMLNACKQVSADYDVVTAFFEDMNSFLQRVTILETRLPKYRAYRNCLMEVFTSLLTLCGFATRYVLEGRFSEYRSSIRTLEAKTIDCLQRNGSQTCYAARTAPWAGPERAWTLPSTGCNLPLSSRSSVTLKSSRR